MNRLKKLSTYLSVGILLSLSSCKDFLIETPYDFVSPENIQNSPSGVKQLITGMYGTFFNAQMFRNESWIYLTCSDNDWTNGLDWVMGTYGVGNFAGGWIYNNPGNDPYYVFYRMIRSANTVLSVLPGVEFPREEEALVTQFEGEALTMRALAYFYLVQMYGPVPLHLRVDDPANKVRSPITDVYAQIIQDLNSAEQKLFLKSKTPNGIKRGHFTKGAAQLLLAKVYATMASGALENVDITVPLAIERTTQGEIVRTEKTFTKNKVAGYQFEPLVAYDSVRAVVKRLIDSREYEIERFASTWNPANFGGTDFVFALETDSATQVAFTPFNRFFTPPGLKGQGWLHYTKDLYYLYDSKDERGIYGIAKEWKSNNKMPNGVWKRQFFPAEDSLEVFEKYGRGNVLTDTNSNSCYIMKWYVGNAANPRVLLQEGEAENIVTTPTQNFPLLRFAEAYLLLAEAENELNGGSDAAIQSLNTIRSYRFTNGYEELGPMNQQQLRSFILDERNREFIGEGYRRFDLLRWGIYLQVMNGVELRRPNLDNDNGIISKRREQKHLLYPVPTIEIDGNTLFGPNNLGW